MAAPVANPAGLLPTLHEWRPCQGACRMSERERTRAYVTVGWDVLAAAPAPPQTLPSYDAAVNEQASNTFWYIEAVTVNIFMFDFMVR